MLATRRGDRAHYGGSPVLIRTHGFVSVTSPGTGIYCLRAASGINLANSAPVATEEQNLSTTLGLVTVRRSGIPNVNCDANELQVTTWLAARRMPAGVGSASQPTVAAASS